MNIRKLIFWFHLGAAVFAGTVVLIMSATGVLLAYQRQIVARMEQGFRSAPPREGAQRLRIESLLTQLHEQQPSLVPATLTVFTDPRQPTTVGGAGTPGPTVYLDPYTGAVLSASAPQIRTFFQAVTNWHRYLGASLESRSTGRSVTGACNLLFLFIVTSGAYLWWPRKVVWFGHGLKAKARNWNRHNVFGSWCAIPLFLIVLTGVIMSYPWANDLLYKLTGNEPPAEQGGGEAARRTAQSPEFRIDGMDALWARAEQQVPGWSSISMRLPGSLRGPVTFTIDLGNGGQPEKRSTLTLDRKTVDVVKWETFSDQNLGRRLRSFARFTHTGEAFGLVGQTVAGIASFGAVMLVWTGGALAIRRCRTWLRARASNVVQQPGQPLGQTSAPLSLNDKETEEST